MLQLLHAVTHVGPLVVPAAGERDQVIPGQSTRGTSSSALGPVAVLAAVTIAGKEERVGDLAAETAGDVHELTGDG